MQKLSMGLSVCIALSIVSIFCFLSILIVENIYAATKREHVEQNINLENSKELSDLVL